MSKNRSKYIIFSLIILSISFYAFLTGCKGSAGSDTPVSVYYNGNSEEPKTINVNITKEGKAVRTAAPSGKMAIEANEENTFNSNVVLTITESPSMGNESNLLSVGSIIYGITATREGLPVNMLSHPLTITLYNEDRLSGAEDYYIGIKNINGGEWQFVNLYSTNPSARTSTNFTNEFRYSIYKNNVLVALFADVKKSLKNTPKVFGSSASLTPTTLAAKKANYEEDLKVSILLAGENLSGLNAEDFKIKIAYLNSDAHDTTLKVDDKKVSYLSGSGSNKYEGFGQGYAHYFQFVPSSTKYTSGFSPTISFDINLEDIEVSKFPNSFIVEISNSDSKILPFAYSSILSFGIKDTETSTDTETETETETNTNTDTNTGTGTSTGVDTKATIKLNSPAADYPVTESTIELEFSSDVPWVQNDLTKITIDNNAEISNCSYNNKKLTLTLKNRLNYTSTYNVRVSNLSYAEDNSFTFTTEEKATVSLKSVASDFPIKDSPIELEFSKDIPWSVQYAEHISVDNGVNITSYQYNNKVLTLGFSGKLNYSKTYKVSVAEFEAAVKNDNLSFTTKSLNVTPVISSASQNVAPNTDDMFTVLQPKFFVNFGKVIANSDLAKNSIKLNGAALPQSCRITFDAASQTATIQFTENLEYYKEYQLSITGYTDDDGGEINSTVTALTFTTNYPEEIIGEGTQESPYLIFNETHLRKLNETTPVNYLGGNVYFKQMMNISLNDDWTPIGDDSNPFIGHYDGNDKFISGIRFNNGSADYVGFFGKVSNSTIASLTLKD
ncbi:MAG: hypothetical protein II567_08105, partial [Candidatus Riflebacteria bacterium]|nr:hypothetical protein [Candidatus Riflebacteria bacterium]